jgi:hypothetical protein
MPFSEFAPPAVIFLIIDPRYEFLDLLDGIVPTVVRVG